MNLIDLLRQPSTAPRCTPEDWNLILPQARRNQLLGQLAGALQRAGALERLPAEIRRHLELDAMIAQRRGEAAAWEMQLLARSLPPGLPLIWLKGCAYLLAQDVNATGRIFSDLDVMVPQAHLAEAEQALIAAGYKPSTVDAHDNRYYREWMHELPPMEHVRRHTTLDLHHAINPPVSRFHVPAQHLWDQALTLPGGLKVLHPVDRMVHCALHLVAEGETGKLLRELWDLHVLLEQHAPQGQETVLRRAEALGVGHLVAAAVTAARTVYQPGASIPGHSAGASRLQRLLVTTAFARIESGAHADARSTWGAATADLLLLAHAHWIKMPMRLLVPHLARKAWLGMRPQQTASSP
jgi:hypothetical protein